MAVVEVVSACHLNVLLVIEQHDRDYGRTERCAVSRKQHNVSWYNVADYRNFYTTEMCECVHVVSSIKFPNILILSAFVFFALHIVSELSF